MAQGQLVELNRHNLATESLNLRDVMTRERSLNETYRHNVESESEARRSNLARETELLRHNTANEQIGYAGVAAQYASIAQMRESRAMDVALGYAQLGEQSRHNYSQEREVKRSNFAKERETTRSNRQRETQLRNQYMLDSRIRGGQLSETQRHNVESERQVRKSTSGAYWRDITGAFRNVSDALRTTIPLMIGG